MHFSFMKCLSKAKFKSEMFSLIQAYTVREGEGERERERERWRGREGGTDRDTHRDRGDHETRNDQCADISHVHRINLYQGTHGFHELQY